MNNYIVEITKELRDNITAEWASRIYRTANINVVDDAYSANNVDYKFSAYVLPLDTTTGISGEGVPAIVHRFGVYLFIPNSNSMGGVDTSDEYMAAQVQITDILQGFTPTGGLEEIEFSSGREYRYGRGYVIYELQYQFYTPDESYFEGDIPCAFYNMVGEKDGHAVYDTIEKDCRVERTRGVSRDINGISSNHILSIRCKGDIERLFRSGDAFGGHDFVVVKPNRVYTSKQDALNDKHREVYAINSIRRFYDKDGEVIGCEMTGA